MRYAFYILLLVLCGIVGKNNAEAGGDFLSAFLPALVSIAALIATLELIWSVSRKARKGLTRGPRSRVR